MNEPPECELNHLSLDLLKYKKRVFDEELGTVE